MAGCALLATSGAGLLALTSMLNSAFAFGDDTALGMGPSGFPVPPPTYLDAVDKLFRQPHPLVARQPVRVYSID